MNLTERIFDHARSLGFDAVGIAPVSPIPHLEAYRAWLAQGYHGEMGYMARPDRVERREDPTKMLPGARAVVCVGLNYYPGAAPEGFTGDPSRGLISNYAWGLDYHDMMASRVEELAAFIAAEVEGLATHRAYVDTGPILERAYAAEAGLGFVGKNTCLVHPRMGSWLFLGEILLDVALEPTPRETGVSCGTCRRCMDACPTGALVMPYVLDARRCISYLTIELKGPIPHDMRPSMGNWIYGCDVCQAVCPWQRFARPTREHSFSAAEPARAAPALLDLLGLSEEAFERRYRGTPISRIGRQQLLRNAAVSLGNWGGERAIPGLTDRLADAGALVRAHSAWALGRIGGQAAARTLAAALGQEADPLVRHELRLALQALETAAAGRGNRAGLVTHS